jgi:hypothetical protein
MPNNENQFPAYYDGSQHVEFSEEISEGIVSSQKQIVEPADIEKCRHLLGANPF